jgi:hypothetical protein
MSKNEFPPLSAYPGARAGPWPARGIGAQNLRTRCVSLLLLS